MVNGNPNVIWSQLALKYLLNSHNLETSLDKNLSCVIALHVSVEVYQLVVTALWEAGCRQDCLSHQRTRPRAGDEVSILGFHLRRPHSVDFS